MRNIKTALFCAISNFRKWYRNPTILVLALIWFVFTMNFTKGLTEWCMENGYRVTPWILPFYISNYYIIFTFIIALIILFSQAPFCDASAPFTIIRTGKITWFIGQFLYILAASFVFVAATAGFQLLILSPALGFSMEWGGVLEGLVEDVSPIRERGCNLLISEQLMNSHTPIGATILTFLLMWLTASLVGTLVLCFNTLFRPGSGIIAAGLVAAWSWFSHLGIFQYGEWMRKTCVFHWCSLMNLQPLDSSGAKISAAVWIQLAVIAVLSGVSLWRFSRRDTAFEKSLF